MPSAIAWTEAGDATIRRMRDERASWDAIAMALGVNRWTAIGRGRHIGASLGEAAADATDEISDRRRGPMPSGHPVSWGAITAGTCLAGAAYS